MGDDSCLWENFHSLWRIPRSAFRVWWALSMLPIKIFRSAVVQCGWLVHVAVLHRSSSVEFTQVLVKGASGKKIERAVRLLIG